MSHTYVHAARNPYKPAIIMARSERVLTYRMLEGACNRDAQKAADRLIMHPVVTDAALFGVPNPGPGDAVKAVVERSERDENAEKHGLRREYATTRNRKTPELDIAGCFLDWGCRRCEPMKRKQFFTLVGIVLYIDAKCLRRSKSA